MGSNRTRPPGSSLSTSLGAADPRLRRGRQGQRRTVPLGPGLGRDDQQRAGLSPSALSPVTEDGNLRVGAGLVVRGGRVRVDIGSVLGEGFELDDAGRARLVSGRRVDPVTDSTGGAAGATLDDVGATFDQGTINDNFATLAAQVDALRKSLERAGFLRRGD